MDISEQWLRHYADPSIDGATLADELTMAGLEVEERRPSRLRSARSSSVTSARSSDIRTRTS